MSAETPTFEGDLEKKETDDQIILLIQQARTLSDLEDAIKTLTVTNLHKDRIGKFAPIFQKKWDELVFSAIEQASSAEELKKIKNEIPHSRISKASLLLEEWRIERLYNEILKKIEEMGN